MKRHARQVSVHRTLVEGGRVDKRKQNHPPDKKYIAKNISHINAHVWQIISRSAATSARWRRYQTRSIGEAGVFVRRGNWANERYRIEIACIRGGGRLTAVQAQECQWS